MAFHELVEGDCGGPSSLMRLTSHFVKDHGYKDEGLHHPFGPLGSFQTMDSDQLVKQFVEETTSCPQTFRMDNLLEEMREIDQNIHPPVAAPGIVKELTGMDTSWATQYLGSGRHFHEHNDDRIWDTPVIKDIQNGARIQETHELGLGPKWAEDYLEQSVETAENDINRNDIEKIENDEDHTVASSKFMKFMRQEGDVPIEDGQVSLTDLEITNEKWPKQLKENLESGESNIEKVEDVDKNPTFAYSKFMKFMRQDGDIPAEGSEASLANNESTNKEWTEQFEEHFQKAEDNNQEIENDAYSKFMKFMSEQGDIPIEKSQMPLPNLESMNGEWVKDFEMDVQKKQVTVDDDTTNEEPIPTKEKEDSAAVGTWIDEFTKETVRIADIDNYVSATWSKLQNEWEKISTYIDVASSHPWLSEYETFYDPFKSYTFSDNPIKDVPYPLEEGKKRLASGDLPNAILCFEAAVQQDGNNAEAWLLLGKTHAENEQDPLAISALKQCLTIDPSNGVALMALAASYTNESYQNQACVTLKEWLLKNEKYKHLVVTKATADQQPKSTVSTILFDDVHEEVRNLYIEAARMNPQEKMDADVQCGLGILFCLSSEYDKAADCFQAALQVRPDDSRLWNRLGATLANGQRWEEAVNVYHRALELSPGFIRARYNLGISCINLGAYKEAGEHLLTALNQQAAGRGSGSANVPPKTMSNTIWSTLRLVVSLMHKYQLNEAIENRDLPRLNKEFEIM